MKKYFLWFGLLIVGFGMGYYISAYTFKSVISLQAGRIYMLEMEKLERDFFVKDGVENKIKLLLNIINLQEEFNDVLVGLLGEKILFFDIALLKTKLGILLIESNEKNNAKLYFDDALESFKKSGKQFSTTEEMIRYVIELEKKKQKYTH